MVINKLGTNGAELIKHERSDKDADWLRFTSVLALSYQAVCIGFNSKALKKSLRLLFVLFALTPVMAVVVLIEMMKEKL